MASQALSDFKERLREVEQLVEAHGALVRLKKAERAVAATKDATLHSLAPVLDALVSRPGVGRPPEVQALNSAAIALLAGHLQGFVTDIYEEAARSLLASHVPELTSLVEAAPTRGNANEQNILRLFATLGIRDVLTGVSWQKVSNKSLRQHLRVFNELRNRIVHGAAERVHKSQVMKYMRLWRNFAERFDKQLATVLAGKLGSSPW